MGQGCGHDELEFLGEQRTEVDANRYYRCRGCGAVIVTTPTGKVYSVGGRSP
jgi:ribosomal protein S27E